MDGKTIEIKPQSELKFIDKQKVELKAGSAVFDIFKKSNFEVTTKLGTARAKGTRFEVKMLQAMIVTVFSGIVELSNEAGTQTVYENETSMIDTNSPPVKIISDKLQELRDLIKKLSDNDPTVRDNAHEKILKLVKGEAKPDLLVKEIEKSIDDTKEEEVKTRLASIMTAIKMGKWTMLEASSLDARGRHTAILSGQKMIIWGGIGSDKSSFNDGEIYDFAQGKWSKIKECPIEKRHNHTAVLYGENMIIWGGASGGTAFNDGAIYDIKNTDWKKQSDSPISERSLHTAAVIGDKMVVWGGCNAKGIKAFKDGTIYDISKDSWEKIDECPLDGRLCHTAVVIGDKMIVWGGISNRDGKTAFSDGAIYDSLKNNWVKMTKSPLEGRAAHTAVVLGDKVIIWGGWGDKKSFNDGAIYDVSKDSWQKMSKSFLDGRYFHTAVLSQEKMIVWGGLHQRPFDYFKVLKDEKIFDDGAIYDIATDKWIKIANSSLKKRFKHTAVISDNKMIIWGGIGTGAAHGFNRDAYNDAEVFELPIVWEND